VDSAEADKVGSREIRFCAYVNLTRDEGVRHRRTTPGAFSWVFLQSLLLQTAAATADRFQADPEQRITSASAAGLPRQPNPPFTGPTACHQRNPPVAG
jgi:hypothetical protein